MEQFRDKNLTECGKSLKKSACGFWENEMKVFVVDNRIRTVKVKRYYPPNPASLKYLMGNLDPQNWREHREEPDHANETIAPVSINIVAKSARVEPEPDEEVEV